MMKTIGRRRTGPVSIAVLAALLALALAACGGAGTVTADSAQTSDTLVGAGATFPAPLYSTWAQEYGQTAGVKLNYQPIGSGGGIEAIEAKTVDFGASDAPLSEADLKADGLVQFPMVMGGIVPVVNLEGVSPDQLKLTGGLLAKIYNGDITTWDDPAIAGANPGVSLRSTKITVVHRSDGSGTTWIFTHYLAAAAPSIWTAGADKEVAWPVGVGGKGNDGVAASVQQLAGSIGYVEYAYAKQTGMTTVQLQNKDGKYVAAGLDTFTAAAEQADWTTPGFAVLLVDLPGAKAWPIVGATFILVHQEQEDAQRAKTMLDYFDWCYASGGDSATNLDYVPIPADGYDRVQRDAWPTITAGGTAVWSK